MVDKELSGRELDSACSWCKGPRPRHNRVFCSKACRYHATWTRVRCQRCNVEFEARRIYLARGQMKFCSKQCANQASVKRRCEVFSGTPYYQNTGGYMADSNGGLLHHAVWSAHRGPIPKGYLVHHKDHNKINNALDNLELMEWGEHTRHHHSTGVPTGTVTCKRCGRSVSRKLADIRRGQNKFCSNLCSNLSRQRTERGLYA